MTRILIADDHDALAASVAAVLADEPTFTVVGRARGRAELREQVASTDPAVVLLGHRLADGGALDACAELRQRAPRTRLLLFVSFPREADALAGFAAGAHGVLVKEVRPTVLRHAVRAVAAGGVFVDPLVAGPIVARALAGTAQAAAPATDTLTVLADPDPEPATHT